MSDTSNTSNKVYLARYGYDYDAEEDVIVGIFSDELLAYKQLMKFIKYGDWHRVDSFELDKPK